MGSSSPIFGVNIKIFELPPPSIFPTQTAGCLSFGYWLFHRPGFFRESINSILEIKNTEKNENSCQRKRLERAQNPTTVFQKSLDRNL